MTITKERPILFTGEMIRAILAGKKTQTRRVIKPQPWYDTLCGGHWYWPTGTWRSVSMGMPTVEKFKAAMLEQNVSMSYPYPRCPYGKPGDRDWQSGMPPTDGYYYVQGFAEDKPVWLRRFLPEDYPGEDITPGLLWARNERGDPEAIEIEGLSLETVQWKRPGDRLWVRETITIEQDALAMVYRADGSRIFRDGHPRYYPQNWPWQRSVLPSIFMPRWASRILLEVTGVRVERVQDISEGDAVAEGIEPKEPNHVVSARYRFGQLWNSINAKRGFGWEANPWAWIVEFKALEP